MTKSDELHKIIKATKQRIDPLEVFDKEYVKLIAIGFMSSQVLYHQMSQILPECERLYPPKQKSLLFSRMKKRDPAELIHTPDVQQISASQEKSWSELTQLHNSLDEAASCFGNILNLELDVVRLFEIRKTSPYKFSEQSYQLVVNNKNQCPYIQTPELEKIRGLYDQITNPREGFKKSVYQYCFFTRQTGKRMCQTQGKGIDMYSHSSREWFPDCAEEAYLQFKPLEKTIEFMKYVQKLREKYSIPSTVKLTQT